MVPGNNNVAAVKCKAKEREALLALKNDSVDLHGILSSWSSALNHSECCKWKEFISIGPLFYELESDLYWVSSISSSLRYLSMEQVDLSSASDWPILIANLPQLRELRLRSCSLPNVTSTSLSMSFTNFSDSLTIIDLYDNQQNSSVYQWLMSFHSSVTVLKLIDNYLDGPIPEAIANLSSLQELWLGDNKHVDGIPMALWDLCSLRVVHLNDNSLTGLIEEFVPTISNCAKDSLKVLDVSENSEIAGTLPNLSHLSSLQVLIFDGNQLESIRLPAIKLGPRFPSWLRSQQERCVWLDISSAGIEGIVPLWFWNFSLSLNYLNVSHNQLVGEIPDLPVEFKDYPQIDLSSNQFHGNNFSGTIPTSFGRLEQIQSLHLRNNKFIGELPLELSNCKELRILDVAHNNLKGPIPLWIGDKLG
ncbi:receptor-like protein 43 [Prosopis cineraria]|uniref:receptor-like protein 43 n=1 Tax=Prosopis cineraria TaxID=364024 RepID=UPI00240F7E9F|nr:receptor-like protein 43 [Prosopis cineraria]